MRRAVAITTLFSLTLVSGAAAQSTDPDVVAEAKAEAAAAAQWPTEWLGPTEPTTPKPGAKVVAISCHQGTACALEVEGIVEGGEAAGWEVQVVDGKGDPAVYASAIRNAVNSGADGIILASINVGLVADALRFAKEQGVPVINNASITDEEAGLDPNEHLVAANNPDPNVERGRTMANWLIADSDGTAKVFLYRTQDAGLIQRDDALVERLEECAGCQILGEDWAGFDTTTTPKMTASITSILDRFGEDLQYIVTPYSVADYFAVQALDARGRSDVKIISNSPYPDQVQACANGEYIGAAMGDDLNWVGWEAVDLLSRVLEDPTKPLPDENTIWVTLTKDTCPASGNLSENNTVDFRAKYKELWGVE
jgi:ribose transport system substrate-binding protein